MKSYELTEQVTAETWVAGERVHIKAGPGAVKPKNEGEELLLDQLAAERPELVKVKTTKKAEE